MKRMLSRAAAVAALLWLGLAHATPTSAQQDPLRGLDAYIEQAMRDWQIPGLAIAIVKNDSLVYAKGFGVREVGKAERVDENTIFAVASNTKAVTATAVGLLVQEGKLGWNDPAQKHLPGFLLNDAWASREVNVRDLLSHRAGFATWAGDLLWYGSTLNTDQVLRGVRELEPSWGFRSQYGYTNLMFIAAGQLIPSLTGKPWDAFVRERILTPLGMTRTTTSVRDLERMENVARPHTRIDGKVTAVPYRNVDNAAAAAALNASVRDWAQWLRLQLGWGKYGGKMIVDSVIIAETRTPQTLLRVGATTRRLFPSTHFSAYGLGWFLRDYQGRLLVMHDGGMDGMLSQTGFLPEEQLAIAIFTNYDEQSLFSALLFHVIDAFLGAPQKDYSKTFLELQRQGQAQAHEPKPVAGTRHSVPLAGYAGTYRNELLGDATIVKQGERLQLQFANHPGLKGDLRHWHYDTFESTWADRYMGKSLVTFSIDAEGKPDIFRLKIRPDFVDPLEYTFRRVR